MALEKRIGHIDIAWNDDGKSVKGIASHSHLFTEEGHFVKTVIEPITSLDDPQVKELADSFSATVLVELQELRARYSEAIAHIAELEQELKNTKAAYVALLDMKNSGGIITVGT